MNLKRLIFKNASGDLLINTHHPAGFRCWFPLREAMDINRKISILNRYTRRIDKSAQIMEKLQADLWRARNDILNDLYPRRMSKSEKSKAWEDMVEDLYDMTCQALADYSEIQGFRGAYDFDDRCAPVDTDPQPPAQDDQEQ